jgi:hypothetical protein
MAVDAFLLDGQVRMLKQHRSMKESQLKQHVKAQLKARWAPTCVVRFILFFASSRLRQPSSSAAAACFALLCPLLSDSEISARIRHLLELEYCRRSALFDLCAGLASCLLACLLSLLARCAGTRRAAIHRSCSMSREGCLAGLVVCGADHELFLRSAHSFDHRDAGSEVGRSLLVMLLVKESTVELPPT